VYQADRVKLTGIDRNRLTLVVAYPGDMDGFQSGRRECVGGFIDISDLKTNVQELRLAAVTSRAARRRPRWHETRF
jgi:hypothetical protein